MKFAFTTCVQLGLACMEEIYRHQGRLDLVMTLPDDVAPNKSGRIYLDEFCARHGIPLVKVRSINDDKAIQAITDRGIDWLFIIGWSQIAGAGLLRAPRSGCLGMHPTLLPQGRGRAAVPWAILKGLTVTGVTLFKLDEGVDTGPILAQERIPIDPAEMATELYKKVDQAHRKLIADNWRKLVEDKVELTAQDETQATVWPGRKPEDGRIGHEMTCQEVERLVRAVTRPYPGAFFDFPSYRLRIWRGQVVICQAEPAPDARETGVIIELRDGLYLATEWEKESL